MRNGVLFLHIHEGIQISQYRKPDENKSRKKHYGGRPQQEARIGKTWRVQV